MHFNVFQLIFYVGIATIAIIITEPSPSYWFIFEVCSKPLNDSWVQEWCIDQVADFTLDSVDSSKSMV